MIFRLAADGLLLLHLAFIVFVMAGGLLAIWKPGVIWLHLPAVVWGMLIELFGWVCPLTPLENHFRKLSGECGYQGGFIDHYLLPVIYPESLTIKTQFVLGGMVLIVNAAVYFWLWRRGTWNRQ